MRILRSHLLAVIPFDCRVAIFNNTSHQAHPCPPFCRPVAHAWLKHVDHVPFPDEEGKIVILRAFLRHSEIWMLKVSQGSPSMPLEI